ncbi:MAG: hypothetical protein JWN31_901 [Frankiales bacterium]|nr:hypothetical protein [Frankiales bacterium]
MAGGHNVRATSWISVLLIIVATIVLGFALPMQSLALAIVGGVLLVIGLGMGAAFRIMDDAY